MPIDLNNKTSHYYSCDVAIDTLRCLNDSFCLLSLNCQSLNAKFDKPVLLIEHFKLHNFAFSAICLQETWLEGDADLSLFQIPGYTCISKGKYCSPHGGLIIYLQNHYQ